MIIPTWAKIAAAAVALMAALGSAYSLGASLEAAKAGRTLASIRAQSSDALAAAERRTGDAERAGQAALYAQASKYLEEEKSAKDEIDRLRADVRAARVRLSVPVASCSAPSATGGDPSAPAEPRAEARAELMPQTADDLIGIASDGDSAVRQLNRLIDAYEALRLKYNALGAGNLGQ